MATNTAAYSIRLRVRLDNRPGTLGHLGVCLAKVIGDVRPPRGIAARLIDLGSLLEQFNRHCQVGELTGRCQDR